MDALLLDVVMYLVMTLYSGVDWASGFGASGFEALGFGFRASGFRGFMASGSRWTRAFIQVMGVMI